MVRQTEDWTGGPMLPKTVITTTTGGITLEENSTATWMRTADAELQFVTAGGDFTAADPKSTITVDETTNSFTLPSGKWEFEVYLLVDETAGANASLGMAVTDLLDTASQVLYAELAQDLSVKASMQTGYLGKMIVELTETTSGIQVRAANTVAGGGGTLVTRTGSYIKITKVANKYDQ